jgi:hypothetical protein
MVMFNMSMLPHSESEVADEEQQQEAMQQKMANRLYRYELVNDKLINPKLLLSLPANSPDPNTENNHDDLSILH